MRTRWIVLASLVLSACSEPPPSGDPEDGVAVPPGKADDFYSTSAYEYVLEGRTRVTLEPTYAEAGEDARTARVKELIGYKHVAIAWFLTQYFIDKESDADNASFGGFGGNAKGGAYEDLDVVAVDNLTYEYTFRQIVAGKTNLMSLLPLTTGADGKRRFELAIGKPSNAELAQLETNNEWYRRAPWSSWNPDSVPDDKKEVLSIAIEREKDSTDAWFDYAALLSDGKLDIDIHFGWDYHSEYHVKHARSLFSWLGRRGFDTPVATFDELRRDSGPFTRTIDADGREVTVEVRLFYGKTGTETDPDTDAGGIVLENDLRESLRTRDVIVYSGHSGPFYGFALANWRKTLEGDFDDSEMATAEMPARYQIVMAEGCDTYHIGEAFKRNPAKAGGGLIDIITTTSFSNAGTPAAVQDFLARLVELDTHGRHRPRTLKSLLTDLDSNSYWFHTMYGIHGIDDNPALHPYARVENLCAPCSRNADCGGPGNQCVRVGSSRACVAACTDDRGCPSDYACTPLASESAGGIYASACVPTSFTCR